MNTDRQFKYLYAHGAGRLLGAKGWRPGLDMWVYGTLSVCAAGRLPSTAARCQ